MRSAALIVFALLGCSHASEAPTVTASSGIVADIHVHQFADGSHLTAGFVDQGVPLHDDLDDQLAQYVLDPVARDGACALYVTFRCDPICPGDSSYCSATNVCSPYTPKQYLDAGVVTVLGAARAPVIHMQFQPNGRYYLADVPPTRPIFDGGESITVDVPAGRFGLHATATAPHAPVIASPTTLHVTGAPLVVSWAGKEGRVAVRLIVSTKSGDGAELACVVDDTGGFTLPASLLSKLPPAPRDLHLEVDRFVRTVVPLERAGESASLYVASTDYVAGFD